MVLFAGPTPTSSAYEASEVLWAHPQEEARQPGASLWAGAAAGVMVVQRRRWIKTGATWEARAEGQVGPLGERRCLRTGMGSRRLIMAAAKIMAVQRKRWIRTGAAWAV